MEDEIADRLEDMSVQPGGGKRGGGRKGGGGGGGGRGPAGAETVVSRALSRLLRHQAEKAGIKLDAEGYAPLDVVVRFIQLPPSACPPILLS